MLIYVLYGLFILSCLVLVVAVLLQPGKADPSALFSSSISSTAFGPRGTQTLLAKITIGAAAAFMLIALTLSLPALTGTRSVLQSTTPEPTPQASPAATIAPAAPATSPAQEGTGGSAPSGNTNTSMPGGGTGAPPANSPQANTSPSR